jgi:hypothetical protein
MINSTDQLTDQALLLYEHWRPQTRSEGLYWTTLNWFYSDAYIRCLVNVFTTFTQQYLFSVRQGVGPQVILILILPSRLWESGVIQAVLLVVVCAAGDEQDRRKKDVPGPELVHHVLVKAIVI